MSKKILVILLLLVSLASAALALDGLYPAAVEEECAGTYLTYGAVVSALHQLNLQGMPQGILQNRYENKEALKQNAGPSLFEGLFSGVTTNINFDFNAQNDENAPVSQAALAANLSASKGPFTIQYTHSRNYSRSVDAYYGSAEDNFQGVVDNRITIGASFQPEFKSSGAGN